MRYSILSSLFADPRNTLMILLLALPGRLLAISAHESAHGWVAEKCGDPTARMMGRITLNPLAHLDPIGIACMLLLGLGWAKPVPVNPRNFRGNYRRADLLVSIAGVTMNLILFLLGSIVYYIVIGVRIANGMYYAYPDSGIAYYLMEMLWYFIFTNLSLAIFNLIPVPPLDGYHVLNDLVLKRNLFATQQAQYIGRLALLAAMYSGVLSRVMSWAMNGVWSGLYRAALGVYQMIGIL